VLARTPRVHTHAAVHKPRPWLATVPDLTATAHVPCTHARAPTQS